MEQLDRCPYCGGRATIRKSGNGYVGMCVCCGARGKRAVIKEWHDNKFIAQEQAKKFWNDRVASVVLDDELETILICAERYSIGRRSYMPSLVIGYIIPLLPRLSERALSVLERDITNAEYYGDETIDKPDWMSFIYRIREELERRKEKSK